MNPDVQPQTTPTHSNDAKLTIPLIDLDVESQGNLLSDPWTAPARIALLCLDDGFNEFFAGSFWTGPRLVL
jgi:hypothetical protein